MTGFAYDLGTDREIIHLSLLPGSLDVIADPVSCFALRLERDDADPADTYRLTALVPTDDSGIGLARALSDDWIADMPAPTIEQAVQEGRWRSLFARLPDVWSDVLTEEQTKRLTEILLGVGLSSSQADQIVRRMNESSTPTPHEGSLT